MNSKLRQAFGQLLILVSLGVALGLTLKHEAVNGESEDGSEKVLEIEGGGARLEEWLYEQRAYPGESIPLDAGEKMLEQLTRMESESVQLFRTNGDPEPVWAPLGPEPILYGQTFGLPRNNVSGRVSALAVDPRYDGSANRTIYLGGAQGGVWKSVDNGAQWSPITEDQSSQAIGAIAIDPQSPETIYVGLGEGSRCALCYYGSGMLKSTDGGSTWTQINGPGSPANPNVPVFSNSAFTRIAIDPATPSTIYATTTFGYTGHATSLGQQLPISQVGLWRSGDGGATWSNLDPGGTSGAYSAHDVIVDPLNPNILYAGMRTIGIYRSLSKGAPGSWVRLGNGLPDVGANPTGNPSTSPYRRVAMTVGPPIAPSTSSTVYAAFGGDDDNLLGIYRTVDNGNSWTATALPQRPGQTNYNLDIAVDPTDGNVVYYGTSANSQFSGGTLWRTRDGGQSWQDISVGTAGGGLHADTHRIAISRLKPATIFTGNDGGIWRCDNSKADGVNWSQLNNTLSLSQFVSMALHPTNPNRVYGGTQDNGTNMYIGNRQWDHVADGDGGYVIVDQSDPRVVYHTYYNVNIKAGDTTGAQIGPRVSTGSGGAGTWVRRGCFGCTTAVAGNFNPNDRVAFYAPMAQNTGFTGTNGNVIYFGTNRIYRTANRGVTWTGLGENTDGFGKDLTKGTGVITAIAANPLLDQSATPPGEVVWVGTSDGTVQVTTNGGALAGATFTNVTRSPLPNRFISEITVDPNNPQHAIVVYSGFDVNTPATPGHVFVTTNLGQTWTNITGNLPDVPVTSVTLNPTNPNTIYLGTDLGVFQTVTGGTTWSRLGNGMPRVATFAVRYQAATSSLFAATHGRGIYRLTIPAGLTSVSAASYSGTAAAPESILSGFGTDLAGQTEAAGSIPLPTSLAGSRISVRDSLGATRYAPIFYAAPGQVNYLVPSGTAVGPASVLVANSLGMVAAGTIDVQPVAPAIFTANANGRDVPAGFAIRIGRDGSQTSLPIYSYDSTLKSFVTTDLDLGGTTDQTVLVLFGTGLRFLTGLNGVSATIGGSAAQVVYAGKQPEFIGLDQINLLLPSSLAGRGAVQLQLTVDGKAANPVTLKVK